MLSICRSFAFLIFTREYSVSLLQSHWIARSRASGLLTCEALQGFTLTQKWRRHFCRQRTKFAAFPVRPGTIFWFGSGQSPGVTEEFRGRLSFWQGTDIIQVLRCTLYAEVLKLYRVTLSRAEVCPKLYSFDGIYLY